jgi:TM2 domain-containing membrane protein YozV
MSGITKIIYTLVTVLLLSFIITSMFSFFGIGFDIYGNYLLWFIALAVFYSILPAETGTIFK